MLKNKILKLIGFLLIFIFALPTLTAYANQESNIIRKEEQITKTPVYEEKKITLKTNKPISETINREKVDFEILVDASGSMKETNSVEKTKEIIKEFITTLDPNFDRVSITSFRGPGYDTTSDNILYKQNIKTFYEMGNNFDKAKDSLDQIEFGGLTPLLDGLEKSKNNLDNSSDKSNKKVLIILGDGHPNVGPERDYYLGEYGDYFGSIPNYYPGHSIMNQLDNLNEDYSNNLIDSDTYFEKEAELNDKLELYPGSKKISLSDPICPRHIKNLKGSIYDNSKADFYELKYLINKKVNQIKNNNYEVFSILLNNEQMNHSGYKHFLENTNETKKLFEEIATDKDHFFYSENINNLTKAFNDIANRFNTFDYLITDTIEDGFELMPETFYSTQANIKPTINGKNLSWKATNVTYNELEVSYHIKKEIPEIETPKPQIKNGTLIVKHIDSETGNHLSEIETFIRPVNEPYTTSPKNISGYKFIASHGNTNGKFTEEPNTIIYKYSKVQIPPVTPDIKEPTIPSTNNNNNNKVTPTVNKPIPSKQTEEKPTITPQTNPAKTGEKTLPKTGESAPTLYYIAGFSFIIAGIFISLKKNFTKKNQ
ncbi:MAG: MucBP domain-containing protein [Clostridium sp.]